MKTTSKNEIEEVHLKPDTRLLSSNNLYKKLKLQNKKITFSK
jgi:hypothetical protein